MKYLLIKKATNIVWVTIGCGAGNLLQSLRFPTQATQNRRRQALHVSVIV